MSSPAGTGERSEADSIQPIAELIRQNRKFLLTTHEGPDGDALGSLLGTQHMLESLGKDSVMFLAAKEFPLPIEYRHLPLEDVFHEPPADLRDRVVIFLDCGNIDRMPVDFLRDGGMTVVNIDHLRAVDGIRAAAVIKDQVSRGDAARKVSLRAGDDSTDVSVIARRFGGGGHVKAAGCSTELDFDQIVAVISEALAEQPES